MTKLRSAVASLIAMTSTMWLSGCSTATPALKDPMPAFVPGTKILFQGDSITDGNRGRNADQNHILGHGYQFIIACRYGAELPERKLLVINSGPGEYVFVGGPVNVTFTPNTPGPNTVRLASSRESILADGRWVPGRWLNGDETDHHRRWPYMRSLGIYRIKVCRRD